MTKNGMVLSGLKVIKIDYNDFKKFMMSKGWNLLGKRIFTEKDSNVKLFSYKRGEYDYAIIISCPHKLAMSICGLTNDYKDIINNNPYTIKLKFADQNGVEIPSSSIINIKKLRTGGNGGTMFLGRVTYDIIRDSYKFRRTTSFCFQHYAEDFICIYTHLKENDIDKNRTELRLEADVWKKESDDK